MKTRLSLLTVLAMLRVGLFAHRFQAQTIPIPAREHSPAPAHPGPLSIYLPFATKPGICGSGTSLSQVYT